ncbi:MAG: hypothetical protein GC191_06715 [Azospirillum sp.]|nr:hypothetical protein [Azospirillum sp.]
MAPAAAEAASFVRLDFTDIDIPNAAKPLGLNQGFQAGASYRLAVSLGFEPDPRFSGEGAQPAVVYPDPSQERIQLHVALFSGDPAIEIVGKPLDILEWPRTGRTAKPAEFTLRAAARVGRTSGRLDLMIYYRTNLLYFAKITVVVGAEDEVWQPEERPIRWLHQDDVDARRSRQFRRFADAGRLAERALNLLIQKNSGDDYLMTAFMGRAELPARVTLRRAELAGNLVEMRGLLDRLRRERIYIEGGRAADGVYGGDFAARDGTFDASGTKLPRAAVRETFKKFMDDIAVLGSRIWDNLFASESARILRDAIEEHLRDGDVIQIWIDRGAEDFLYPWAWLYGQTLDPDKRHTVNTSLFWGYRYVIEQLPQYPETMGRFVADEIPSATALSMKIGVFQFTGITDFQKEFFKQCAEKSRNIFRYEVWDSDDPWEKYLPNCDSGILYFFSHGHTAKPATLAGQEFYDMLAQWQTWLARVDPEDSEFMRDYRTKALAFLAAQPPQLLAETHIKLTYGNLLLRELRNLAELSKSAPLVLLNMCESAQVFPDISEGLIDIFLKKGARAVIGTEIPMLPEFADLFARRFFEAFLFADVNGRPEDREAGRILHCLRREFLDKANPLAFAYTLFGSAGTRLEAPFRPAPPPPGEEQHQCLT